MSATDPTAMGSWLAKLTEVLPEPIPLPFRNVHLLGPFENSGYQGLLTTYPPEQEHDLTNVYQGKRGEVKWQPVPALEGNMTQVPIEASSIDAEPWSVLYAYAEIAADQPIIAVLSVGSPGMVWVWTNDQLMLSPMIPRPAHILDDRFFVALQPGVNRLLFKFHFSIEPWQWEWHIERYGDPQTMTSALKDLTTQKSDNLTRILAWYTLTEIHAAAGDVPATLQILEELRKDPFATRWDITWADMIAYQYQTTGSFLPLHDVPTAYTPIMDTKARATFWPQSPPPAKELVVVDVSEASPQLEFALGTLQGLVNREKPVLYLLHTRYARQDRQWLEELQLTGYAFQTMDIEAVWRHFRSQIKGAILYDGAIMNEIGDFHSDQLNQTNVLMMIGSLENGIPITPEMNNTLQLPVIFDARGRWKSQYEMMRWAFEELFPRMDQRILATNYPGIFLLTDYLVAHKIFTFWFPEHRVLPEDNLLNGILASTPPNTPIIGWWFDWMPNPKDPELRHADAVMEEPGLLRGSAFGKVLTPSHEATNLSVHSGVSVGTYRHKTPNIPKFDPKKVYYTHILSDGDNLGEALMMRTRDLQWDQPERGSIPLGWSFAPAAAVMAPPVLNYYLRTATAHDLLVGGLGIGYTEPMMYLRAYPEQREELYASYVQLTDKSLKWIDTSCLWLINGGDEEENRYAEGSSGQLQGIFTGYGGAPEMAQSRMAPNNVVAFRSATRLLEGQPKDINLDMMEEDIRTAAGESRPGFIEAWVLNWDWSIEMLQEIQHRLSEEFVCVRPDVLVQLRHAWEARGIPS